MKTAPSLTGPVEDCLIAIATLRDDQIPSIPARIAERLEISLPSAGETLKRLQRDGYVIHDEGREYRLSVSGQEVADKLMRRHRLIERWLTDVLKLDWATAHTEAHRLEHGVSDLVAEQLAQSMNYPSSCPHGNPISPDARSTNSHRLTEIEDGQSVVVKRISEIAEDNGELMTYYEREGFRPGATIEIQSRGPMGKALDVTVNGRPVTIASEWAAFLWVEEQSAKALRASA
ncbi:MAG TPA: metal-dependent transcriptional regulator [Dehalococcoidia bacterium]|nr:metal-dependent transcriptional regulator [Dehalococcoidia bacterium]